MTAIIALTLFAAWYGNWVRQRVRAQCQLIREVIRKIEEQDIRKIEEQDA